MLMFKLRIVVGSIRQDLTFFSAFFIIQNKLTGVFSKYKIVVSHPDLTFHK
jgi:hypothetical protein